MTQFEIRIKWLGIQPFGAKFPRTSALREITDSFASMENQHVVVGRIMAIRGHGKVSFARL